MEPGCGPVVMCQHMAGFDAESWTDIQRTFGTAEPVSLHQGWLAAEDPAFRPAVVRCGWNEGHVFVYAALEDVDIFNPITEFNEPSFLHGDVFEIFLRPSGQDAYYEFHVTPRNQRYQLRVPSTTAFHASAGNKAVRDEWRVHDWQIESRVRVDVLAQHWLVFASIPLAQIVEHGRVEVELAFSFSRYDCTRGANSPVLSSTSPHKTAHFHRQQEWGRLILCERISNENCC
ncbi:MAG TPA: hypothetical protein DCS43_00120 [Verrucomicrobia bacterium]|nr:hypothetical protein [Verrucomicrobiota bacterium]